MNAPKRPREASNNNDEDIHISKVNNQTVVRIQTPSLETKLKKQEREDREMSELHDKIVVHRPELRLLEPERYIPHS